MYDKSKMAREPCKKTIRLYREINVFRDLKRLESLRISIFWKQLIIAEVLSTTCVISAEFLVKI